MRLARSQIQGVEGVLMARWPDAFGQGSWVAGVLGLWLGVTAMRGYFVMVVMNAAENAPPLRMGLIGLAVWAVALGGWLPARFAGGRRPAWRFGLLLAVLTCLRQALAGEMLSPTLAFAAVIAWFWWFPAFMREVSDQGTAPELPAGLVLGFAFQAAGQTALHGLALVSSTGPWSVLGTALLSGAFILALWQSGPRADLAVPAPGSAEEPTAGTIAAEADAARGAMAFGLYLFLQMTGLSQVARVEMLTGWPSPLAGALVRPVCWPACWLWCGVRRGVCASHWGYWPSRC